MTRMTFVKRMTVLVFTVGCLSGAAMNAFAADKKAAGRPSGFLVTMERTVGISPEQREAIRGLMAQQREEMKKIRATTDTKIRAVLTPDQQKKFDAFLAEQKAKRATRGV